MSSKLAGCVEIISGTRSNVALDTVNVRVSPRFKRNPYILSPFKAVEAFAAPGGPKIILKPPVKGFVVHPGEALDLFV